MPRKENLKAFIQCSEPDAGIEVHDPNIVNMVYNHLTKKDVVNGSTFMDDLATAIETGKPTSEFTHKIVTELRIFRGLV
jgi:hypothetical protein